MAKKKTKKKTIKSKVKGKVGRPRASYKWRHPITGSPISATQYYKVRRALKGRAKAMAEEAMIRNQMMLARRGMMPQGFSQVPQYQHIPQPQIIRQIAPIQAQKPFTRQIPPIQPQFRVVTDIMTGRKIIKPIPLREKWIR